MGKWTSILLEPTQLQHLPHLLGLALGRSMAPSFLLSTAKPLQTLLILPLLHSKLVFIKFRAVTIFPPHYSANGNRSTKANYEVCRQEKDKKKTIQQQKLHTVQNYIN